MNINENLEDRVETIVFLSKEQLTIEELAKYNYGDNEEKDKIL